MEPGRTTVRRCHNVCMETNSPWLSGPPSTSGDGALAAPVPVPGAAPSSSEAFGRPRRSLRKRIGGGLAAAGAAVAKFLSTIKTLILLLPKAKLLAFGASAVVSVVAYGLVWGYAFAVGFVVLLFVHEMGHVIQLRREGIKASAPFFIPFLGAVVTANLMSGDALREARVGLAGPVLGTIGAALCVPLYWVTGTHLFLALAYIGFFLNLFNLLPVLPLDGGRAMAAMAPWMWFVGFVALIPVAVLLHGPIVFLVIIFGGREIWSRWRARKSGSLQQAAYYRVSPRARLAVGLVYIGLIAALAIGMHLTYVTRAIA